MTLNKLSALLLAVLSVLPAQQRFGLPACAGPDREFADRSFFLLCHDSSRKVPLWVGYELSPSRLLRLAARPSHFRPDPDLARPGASDADYKRSGFSRGHMAPAADFSFSPLALRSTFLLSNSVPQKQNVNAGRWAQLESAVRRLAAGADLVVVFSGPLFESDPPELIGEGRVAVPSHTYKVVLALEGNRKKMYAAIVPNTQEATEPLNRYATTVDEVERRTGLDFFAALEDAEEQQLEGSLGVFPVPGKN